MRAAVARMREEANLSAPAMERVLGRWMAEQRAPRERATAAVARARVRACPGHHLWNGTGQCGRCGRVRCPEMLATGVTQCANAVGMCRRHEGDR